MRSVVLGFLLVAAGVAAVKGQTVTEDAPGPGASAATSVVATPIVIDELPVACRALAIETQTASRNRALSARISLAGCLVDQRLRELTLCDCEQSVLEVEDASTQSVALLDEVARNGDPTLQLLARHALGELFTSQATRMLATIPPAIDASPSALALRETRVQLLAQRLQPWRDRARAAHRDVDQIARANPQLERNAAVVSAVRTSRARLASDEVARR
jgi:hypothetical protein